MPDDVLTPEEIKTAEELAKVQKELAWQLTRAGVDAVTIVDPTGLSNIPAMGMSIYDGDFIGAGLSLVGLIPLLGKISDVAKETRAAERIAEMGKTVVGLTAKLAKLRKMRAEAKIAEEAALASKVAREAEEAKMAAQSAKEAVQEANVIPHEPPARCIPCEKAAAEKAAAERAGESPAVGREPIHPEPKEVIPDPGTEYERNQLATKFYKEHGKPGREIMSHRDGIDLQKPVVVKELQPGDTVVRWEFEGRGLTPGKGDTYASYPGEDPTKMGIQMTMKDPQSGQTITRVPVTYKVTRPVQVLESTAKDLPTPMGAPTVGGTGGAPQLWLPETAGLVKQ